MAQQKYTNGSGVAEIWLNIKNYIASQLLGYSQTGHTHSASDITSGLSTVATSGSYSDLSNKPTIPSNTNQLTNGAGFITSSGSCNYANSAGYVQGNNNSANAANALLRSGSGRTDSSPEGDTWIFVDELGGSGTPWGFKHNQAANTIGFYGAGTETSSINLSNGHFSGTAERSNSSGYADSAGSVAWANVSDKPTIPTKTSDLTNDSGFITSVDTTALGSLASNSIPFHNAYPRCKYLGNSITDAQNTAIKNRTYDDLFIGDYWTINDVNWRIVAIDYYYNVGDTNFDKGNVIVMPDTVLYNAQMNSTGSSSGAYAGSSMRKQNLNNAKTIAQNAFGSHLASHRIRLANTSWSWYDSDGVELPNEVQIYGTRVWGSALKAYDVATQKLQFPLMLFAPQFVNTRQVYWLQDTSSSSNAYSGDFAAVSSNGDADYSKASLSIGVRPSVTLSYI